MDRNAIIDECASVNDNAACAIEEVAIQLGPESAKRGVEIAEILRTAAQSIRDLKS